MDVTTHLRARAAQAGALLALVGGIIAATASPVLAAGPTVVIDNADNQVESGGSATVEFTVSNTDEVDLGQNQLTVNVSGSGMACKSGCGANGTLKAGAERSFKATLTAPEVNAGQTRNFTVKVNVTLGGKPASANATIAVRGPDKPKSVRQVSGKVRDDKGKSVSGAQVIMKDTAGHQYDTTSNGSGGFAFSSSDSKPIAVGTISVGAGKDGFESAAVNVQGAAGKTVNVTLTLASTAAATPSATPSVTEEASAPADDEATDEATDGASQNALDANKTAGEDGNGSLLFIILGGLLVAAGIGAIVLVLMRRKNNGGGDDKDGVPTGGVPGPTGRGGGYGDATRVAAPVGARGNDATMVAGAGGMSDAPTVLQRAVPPEDEFPDPYGVPAQQPGYGGAGQYGAPAQTYGATAAPAPAGYEDEYYDDGQQAAGGYYGGAQPPQQQAAPQQRYDEPTGMYRPEDYAEAGYQQGGAYGHGEAAQPQQQYEAWDDGGAQATYGAANGGYEAAPANGYDNGYDQRGAGYEDAAGYENGYDQRGGAYSAAGYPAQQGYDAGAGGYDQGGGYEAGGGYDQHGGAAPAGGGGYEQGGYYGGEQQAGRRGGAPRQGPPPSEEPARPGQRRLPWMDD